MQNINKLLSNVTNTIPFLIKTRILYETLLEFVVLKKNLGVISTQSDKKKTESRIIILSHAIEKGLSLENPRLGFGEDKIKILLSQLRQYVNTYRDDQFVNSISAILESYFLFNQNGGYINTELLEQFQNFSKDIKKYTRSGGIEKKTKVEILNSINMDYAGFANSRYSIRDFSDEPINIEQILNAVSVSKKTPSACNRQPWHVYIISDTAVKMNLLEWQGGTRGFNGSIGAVIVITCSLKYYFIGENHQAYVDGGLYAMNLILAIHAQGLGSIPLTMGLTSNKLKSMEKIFSIPADEVPIIMIGVGNLKDSFNVAISSRKDITEYVTII